MYKSIAEWFEYLPPGIKEKALFNIKNQRYPTEYGVPSYQKMMDTPVSSLYTALIAAFRWSESCEGPVFWCSICIEYRQEETP
jgi:hypothetical protein